MKFGLFLLVVLPVCFSAPQERFLVDTLITNALNQEELGTLVNQLVSVVGTDVGEQLCEQECNVLVKQEHVLHYACPFVCQSIKTLALKFHHGPTTAVP